MKLVMKETKMTDYVTQYVESGLDARHMTVTLTC